MPVYKPKEKVTFSRTITASDGKPLTPDGFVKVRVVDPKNVLATEGTAYQKGANYFNFDWIVPEKAEPSTINHKWKIFWEFQAAGQQYAYVNEFDVETDIEREFDQILLFTKNEQARFAIVLPKAADNGIRATMMTVDDTVVGTLENFEVTETPQGFMYEQYVNINTIKADDFVVKYNYTISTKPYSQIQRARVAPTIFWMLLPELRILIDKLQKTFNRIQAYQDSDCYEYLIKGMDILNRSRPTLTMWGLGCVNQTFWRLGFGSFLIEAAALWALHAQFILGADLTFSFSGQTVTLEYDQTGPLADEIARLLDDINEKWPQAKYLLMRQSFQGALAGREALVPPWWGYLPLGVSRGWSSR